MPTHSFTIVCAVDFLDMSSVVVEHALSEAHHHRNVIVHFLTVVESRGRWSRDPPRAPEMEAASTRLHALVSDILPAFADTEAAIERKIRFHTRWGEPAEQVLELALEARADRVVIGGHTGSALRKNPGGVAGNIVLSAPCTVHLVRVPGYTEIPGGQCPECVTTREESGGSQWFCTSHREGRPPRLTDSLGLTSPTPGWGLF